MILALGERNALSHYFQHTEEKLISEYEILASVIALVALMISCTAVFFNGIQVKKASETIQLQQELAKGNVIAHSLKIRETERVAK